jgi:hypothetical protein
MCASPSNQYPYTCPIYRFCADEKEEEMYKVIPKLTKLHFVTKNIIA